MTPAWDQGGGLLRGPLLERAGSLPFTLRVVLGDLSARFILKCQVGRGYRAVARNGRVLLASPLPLPKLARQEFRLRFQVWHRAILSGDPPEPYGLLLCVSNVPAPNAQVREEPTCHARLVRQAEAVGDLILDVGGGMSLAFG